MLSRSSVGAAANAAGSSGTMQLWGRVVHELGAMEVIISHSYRQAATWIKIKAKDSASGNGVESAPASISICSLMPGLTFTCISHAITSAADCRLPTPAESPASLRTICPEPWPICPGCNNANHIPQRWRRGHNFPRHGLHLTVSGHTLPRLLMSGHLRLVLLQNCDIATSDLTNTMQSLENRAWYIFQYRLSSGKCRQRRTCCSPDSKTCIYIIRPASLTLVVEY